MKGSTTMDFTVSYKSSSDPVTTTAHGVEVVVDGETIPLTIEEVQFSHDDPRDTQVSYGFRSTSVLKVVDLARAMHTTYEEVLNTCVDVITNEGGLD